MRKLKSVWIKGIVPTAVCLLVLTALADQDVTQLKKQSKVENERVDPLTEKNIKSEDLTDGDVIIDHGDEFISDDHITFRDRGRYPFQDLVCGRGCGDTRVNVVYGNLIYTRQDISIPGRGLPLEVYFTYNSGSFFNGRYGYGWQLNYNIRYVTNSANDNVIVVRSDDRTDLFIKKLDGSFQSTYGVRDSLTEYEPGKYMLYAWHGVKYWFQSDDHHYVTRIEDLHGNTLTFTYNGDKQLTNVTGPAGRQLTFTYMDNMLTSITDPAGRSFQYEYDSNGDMIRVTDPMGYTTDYFYSQDCHDLLSITHPNGHTRDILYNSDYQVKELITCCGSYTFIYHSSNRSTSVTDGNGNTTVFGCDERDRVVEIQDALGNSITRTWDDGYNLINVTDANGNMTTYSYDYRGNVLTATDPLGHSTVRTWHNNFNRMTSVIDQNGNATTLEYDDGGNLIERVDPLYYTRTYAYDSYGQMVASTDPRGYTTQYEYDSYGNLILKTDPTGDVETYSYDPVGNRISETDANGNTTYYSYDPLNRLVDVTDALSFITTYSYDPVGNRISETDANGRITYYSYDGLNRLIDMTDASGYVTTYSYDPVGNRISEMDANGNTTTYTYDPLNRLVGETDALGYIETYSYDPVGNRIGWTDENGNTSTYSYDPLNRLVGETDALGYIETYSYDPVGNRLTWTDKNGNTTTYTYDPLNRLIDVTNALGFTENYSYDQMRNLVSKIDANGMSTHYEYDALSRCTMQRSAMDNETIFLYDDVGNVSQRIDPNGAATDYEYDSLNRLVRVSYPDASQVEYEYDGVGNILRTNNTGGLGDVTDRSYDGLNRLISETIDYGLFVKTVSYTYDAVGNLITLTDPDGQELSYEYDAVKRVVRITDHIGGQTTMAYDPAGRKIEALYPDGVKTAWSYDNGNRVTGIVTRDVVQFTMFEYVYIYDALGQVLQVVKNGGIEGEYQYNPVGWLTGASYSTGQNYQYVYDAAGNRMTQEDNGDLTSYVYNNEYRVLTQGLPSGNAIDYLYDSNGNVVRTSSNWGVVNYEYDFENRLTRLTYPVPYGYIANYYSPEGKRLARDERGIWTYSFPTPLGVVVEMDGVGNTKTRLNPGISLDSGGMLPKGGREKTEDTQMMTYVHWDAFGSTTYFWGAQPVSFTFDYFGGMLDASGNPESVDAGLYANTMKVDWDPMLGAELIDGDYAPDIDQTFGVFHFYPGQNMLFSDTYLDAFCVIPDGVDGGGGRTRKCGVKKFEVKVKPYPEKGGTAAAFRVEVTLEFRTDDDYDPACCEYRQNAGYTIKVKNGPTRTKPLGDDNYSRRDDKDGDNSMSDPDATFYDFPGWTAVPGRPSVSPKNTLDVSFTLEQFVIDICNNNAEVAKKGPKTFTIKGRYPRTFDPPNEITY